MAKIAGFYYKNNRLQQVRGFVNVVKYGGVTRASEQMHLTQSAVSSQITTLERDLGLKLFKKVGVKLELTEDGKQFYEMSVPLFHGIDSLYERFLEKKKINICNTLNIAGHHSVFSIILPAYLEDMKSKNNDLKIHLAYLTVDEGLDRLIKGDIDIAIYPIEGHEKIPTEIETIKAFKYKPVCVLPKGHPLNQKNDDDITFEDIGFENDYLHAGPYAISGIQKTQLDKGVLNTSITMENGNWEIMKALIAKNLGVTIFHEGYIEPSDDVLYKRVYHLSPNFNYCIMIKKGEYLKEPVQKLIELMRKDFDTFK